MSMEKRKSLAPIRVLTPDRPADRNFVGYYEIYIFFSFFAFHKRAVGEEFIDQQPECQHQNEDTA